jgi:hypothetical protein
LAPARDATKVSLFELLPDLGGRWCCVASVFASQPVLPESARLEGRECADERLERFILACARDLKEFVEF